MDPNRAYEDWLHAVSCNDKEGALEAAEALLGWLEKGGFEPQGWLEHHKCSFIAWCDAHEVHGSAV